MADAIPVAPAATPSAAPAASAPAAEKMPGKYKVTTIREKCIGAASCVAIAPKVFQLDGEQKVQIISQDELDDMKLLAAQSCPTQAIVITDIETGEQVWPK
ncbi:MAG TPA: ferredoxin [Candidatus Saccharimonadia bacterium]|nr:ferredoxin [Candidatus Saccharimonadia bacterium]